MERYLGETYINSYKLDIMTKTPETFPDPEITTIITYTGAKHHKTDV